MSVELSKHPLVDGLFIARDGSLEIYFSYVGYDSEEARLIFERDEEVITAKLQLDNDHQLHVWEQALQSVGVELERFMD